MSIGPKVAQIVNSNVEGWLSPVQWTDKSFPSTRLRIGALNKPDFDYSEIGLLFPQNDTSEQIFITDQMLHQKKLGTSLHLHVHFIQSSSDVPNFVAEYRWYLLGAAVPASWTTITTDAGSGPAFTYPGSGSIHQLIEFPEIAAPASETVSSNIDIIFYRDDNVVTGDVLVKFIDYHYQVDSAGSRQEYVK